MEPPTKHIPFDDYPLCNLHPNRHSFDICHDLVGMCEVCGIPTGLVTNLKCTVCGLFIHKACAPNCYLRCIPSSLRSPRTPRSPTNISSDEDSQENTPYENGRHIIVTRKLTKPTKCVVCRSTIISPTLQSYGCQMCGIYVHKNCLPFLPKCCRPLTSSSNKDYHWFIPGNCNKTGLATHHCHVCNKQVGTSATLTDYRCCFCGMFVHAACIPEAPARCHHGVFGKYIIKPQQTKQLDNGKFKATYSKSTLPMIFFVNKKSGNLLGKFLLTQAKRHFSLLQVCDILNGFDDTFEFIKDYYNDFIAVICGGDGTVGWVMNEFYDRGLHPKIFVIPLGTGNDFSQCTGWGAGYNGEALMDVMRDVTTAHVQPIDRWLVDVKSDPPHNDRQIKFNNYFSIGVDAGIALEFHQRREANPEAFGSRIGNKIQYLISSPKALTNSIGKIDEYVSLKVDGEYVDLPPVEGLIFLNLPTYGGGIPFWQRVTDAESINGFVDSHYGDGLLEVVGITNVMHLSTVMSQISSPIKVAQGKVMELKMVLELPAQYDGEPFLLSPCTVTFSVYDSVNMLVRNSFY
ncbi:Diacylglycerol kinase [Entamoeba marina]